MKKNLIEQLSELKAQVHLSASAKDRVRAQLMQAIEGRERATSALDEHAKAPTAILARSFFGRIRAVTAIVAVVILGSAGVSFAAQGARPGDVLYPVKVGVNERAQAAVAFSAQQKAKVAVIHAENRLQEASSLSADGKLDSKTEEELQQSFESRSKVAEDNINKMENQGDVEGAASVAVQFEGTLKAHQAILASASDTNGEDTGTQPLVSQTLVASSSANLAASLRDRIGVFATLRANLESAAEGDISSTDAKSKGAARMHVDAAIKAAASSASASRIRNENGGKSSDSVSATADARAKEAESLAADAQEKFNQGFYSEAFNLGNAALGTAAEAQTLLKAGVRVRTKIDNNRDGHASSTSSGSSSAPSHGTSTGVVLHASSTSATSTNTAPSTSANVGGETSGSGLGSAQAPVPSNNSGSSGNESGNNNSGGGGNGSNTAGGLLKILGF